MHLDRDVDQVAGTGQLDGVGERRIKRAAAGPDEGVPIPGAGAFILDAPDFVELNRLLEGGVVRDGDIIIKGGLILAGVRLLGAVRVTVEASPPPRSRWAAGSVASAVGAAVGSAAVSVGWAAEAVGGAGESAAVVVASADGVGVAAMSSVLTWGGRGVADADAAGGAVGVWPQAARAMLRKMIKTKTRCVSFQPCLKYLETLYILYQFKCKLRTVN